MGTRARGGCLHPSHMKLRDQPFRAGVATRQKPLLLELFVFPQGEAGPPGPKGYRGDDGPRGSEVSAASSPHFLGEGMKERPGYAAC